MMVYTLVKMSSCLCRHTAMQQELEKLRAKLRTADFVRTNSGSGLEQRCVAHDYCCTDLRQMHTA